MRSPLFFVALVACGSPQEPPNAPLLPQPVVMDAAPPEPPKPALAKSTSTKPPPDDAFEVVITSSKGPPDFLEAAKKSGKDDAALVVAPDVEYRVLVDTLVKLQQADIDDFHLIVDGPKGKASIDIEAPDASGPKPRADVMSGSSRRVPRLNLAVLIVSDGISVKVSGGNLVAGCDKTGAGLAIPKRDFDALTACVAKAKSAGPFDSENDVLVSASPNVDFQTLVRTMDALRPSFPDVRLAMVR